MEAPADDIERSCSAELLAFPVHVPASATMSSHEPLTSEERG